MAKVSHHAMRRYPFSQPLESPPQTHHNLVVPAPYFYPTCNQAAEKSKKSWSQRLKLNKNEKSKSNKTTAALPSVSVGNGGGAKPESPSHDPYVELPNGLARTMKYAEPWLYGTVRGIPAPLAHSSGAFFQPIPAEVAVVVCSCPEYLNGTKKEVKKASICKRCKGSRLPLAPIGGTVRLAPKSTRILQHQHQQQQNPHQFYPNGGGTMRLQSLSGNTLKNSNSKSRPSILNNSSDPYDLMRRSRLATPAVSSATKENRHRAKSQSPGRNRSRRRKSAPAVDEDSGFRSVRSRSVGRLSSCSNYSDGSWVEGLENENPDLDERSILRCDVNPYDLIMVGDCQRSTSPQCSGTDQHSDLVDEINLNSDDLNLHSRKYENILNPLFNNKVTGKSMQKSRFNDGNTGHQKRDSVKPTGIITSPGSRRSIDESEITIRLKNREFQTRLHGDLPAERRYSADDYKLRLDSKQQKSIGTKNSNIKSILKKYENVSFAKDDTTSLSESEPFQESSVSRQKELCNKKDSITEKTTFSNLDNNEAVKQISFSEQLISNYSKTVNKTGNCKETKRSLVNPKLNGVSGEKERKTSDRESSSQFYFPLAKGGGIRKKVQFSENNETFRNKYDNPSTNELTAGGSTEDELNTEEQNLGHNCDISKRLEQHNNKSTPSAEGGSKERLASSPSPSSEKQDCGVELDPGVSSSDRGRLVPSKDVDDAKCRIKMVRRSLSDRKLQSAKVKEDQKRLFNDTMALRMKLTKRDARDIDFSSDRPKEPPPPPPPVASSTPIRASSSEIPQRPPRLRKLSQQSNSEVSVISSADAEDNYELFNFQVNKVKRPESGNSQNRIVVPVAPMIRTPEASGVHRLEIRHDSDIPNYKKTSITISGDECYSTVNVSNETALYQSSVVVNDVSSSVLNSTTSSSNTVTINVNSSSISTGSVTILADRNSRKSIVPIGKSVVNLDSDSVVLTQDQCGRTLISLDYKESNKIEYQENELGKLLRNPVEAVRLNLVPHVCGKVDSQEHENSTENVNEVSTEVIKRKRNSDNFDSLTRKLQRNSFISKLLEDPTLGHLAEGLDNDIIAKLIESSLLRLKESRQSGDSGTTEPDECVTKLIDISLQKIQEERQQLQSQKVVAVEDCEKDRQSTGGSISSGNSYSSTNYELFDFDQNADSDCYQSCSSEITTEDDGNSTRSKFYQMLVDATLSEIEISTNLDDDHHYESIRLNNDPIYEEIGDIPPPLPLSLPPPVGDFDLEKKQARSMFEGASKYDILSYLVDAKERGVIPEESYMYNFSNTSDIIIEEEEEGVEKVHKRQNSDVVSRISDASDDTIVSTETKEKLMAQQHRKSSTDIERNDSGVGSETSKSSRNKFLNLPGSILDKNSPIHLCEDCDGPVETQVTDSGVMYAPLVCRKCGKKRSERKEIITEIVETEEKYGRDLQIILEEFYQPMLVAGLLTQEQLSAIFLNTEELLENNQVLAERMRDALDIASEQGDDDLLTVNIGKLFLDSTPMLHSFETYCVGQAAASLLLANLEKEKELLRIFLRVSQMENTVLRRMNLNSFLMVPVQRVTKYPLLLARLYKVTPPQQDGRLALKQAQEKIELHLNHMNREAKDIPTKLWRRISSSNPVRRSTCEIDMINIKLRKMAVDILEWNHEEVRFAMEGKLLFTQPADNNWRKGRTIKLTPINALLVTNGKPSSNYRADRALNEPLNFPRHTGIREASLLLVREKSGRYTLLRDPLYLDRCIICSEADWADYFEVQEISSKDTFIFKAEDGNRTKHWYTQLQYHAQGMGAWRKRRNALANIMINGMMMRS